MNDDLICVECKRDIDIMEHNYGTPEYPVCIQCGLPEFEDNGITDYE